MALFEKLVKSLESDTADDYLELLHPEYVFVRHQSGEEVAKEAKRLGVKGFKDGGEAVPAKFKGFSKLPEGVQQKMDPDLAQKYEKGGAVGSCRGMGAALRGGKFSGVK